MKKIAIREAFRKGGIAASILGIASGTVVSCTSASTNSNTETDTNIATYTGKQDVNVK